MALKGICTFKEVENTSVLSTPRGVKLMCSTRTPVNLMSTRTGTLHNHSQPDVFNPHHRPLYLRTRVLVVAHFVTRRVDADFHKLVIERRGVGSSAGSKSNLKPTALKDAVLSTSGLRSHFEKLMPLKETQYFQEVEGEKKTPPSVLCFNTRRVSVMMFILHILRLSTQVHTGTHRCTTQIQSQPAPPPPP